MNFNDINKEECFLCGACQPACPNGCIEVTDKVLYNRAKCNNCGLCYKVCAGIHFDAMAQEFPKGDCVSDAELGHYVKLFFGQASDNQIRLKGTSGAVARTLASSLLRKKRVDGVIQIVRPGFTIKVCDRDNRSEPCRSVYKQVPLLKALKELDPAKEYAIVGLPCHLLALSKLNSMDMYNNIKYRIGLFCGFNMNSNLIPDMLHILSLEESEVKEIDFRAGPYPGGLTFFLKNGERIQFSKRLYYLLNLLYLPKRCFYCNDFSAEYSDISLGDARVDNSGIYNKSRQWNSIICRNSRGLELLEEAQKDLSINMVEADAAKIKSLFRFNLSYKKKWLGLRLRLAKKSCLSNSANEKEANFFASLAYLPLYAVISCMRTRLANKVFKLAGRYVLRLFRI